MAGMRELTAEEQAKPYAKYYYRKHAGASPELADRLADAKPMEPADALPIERMSDLLDPGYLPGRDRLLHAPERRRLRGRQPSHA